MSELVITVLGCGNSTGVPAIGNYWGACDPAEPKNRRLRSSIAVQNEETTIIIDTGADFREQLNRADINMIDAVLYTHTHSDHVMGIDDLRPMCFRRKKEVPVYGSAQTLSEMKERFGYLFDGGKIDLYPPIIEAQEVSSYKDFKIGRMEILPFEQDHGSCVTTGYRFGDFAYSLDFVNLDGRAIDALKGVKTWIVDGAAYNNTDNEVHANLDTIFALNEKIGASQIYISSLTLAMDYQTLLSELPEGYKPAYDGLKIKAVI